MIRVFPRKTKATPDDENVRLSEPGLFDEPGDVNVSVCWEWDKPKAERLAESWHSIGCNVKIGGPAYDDRGGEFEPGMYIKCGYVVTSRGCPNRCWFCHAWKREGNEMRELEIKDGHDVIDSNLLACSENHIRRVFEMLKRQKEKPRFTGGLEAARMKPWIVDELRELKPETAFFAYDTPNDLDPLVETCRMMGDILPSHNYRCYVLIGYRGDTFGRAEKRLNAVANLGLFPMAMLYDLGIGKDDAKVWRRFQREWANPTIIGAKLRNRKMP